MGVEESATPACVPRRAAVQPCAAGRGRGYRPLGRIRTAAGGLTTGDGHASHGTDTYASISVPSMAPNTHAGARVAVSDAPSQTSSVIGNDGRLRTHRGRPGGGPLALDARAVAHPWDG